MWLKRKKINNYNRNLCNGINLINYYLGVSINDINRASELIFSTILL